MIETYEQWVQNVWALSDKQLAEAYDLLYTELNFSSSAKNNKAEHIRYAIEEYEDCKNFLDYLNTQIAEKEVCIWEHSDDYDWNRYNSSCGEERFFEVNLPWEEIGYKYCPYCGKKIQAKEGGSE